MSLTQAEVQEIELSIKEAKKMVDEKTMLDKLRKDKAFKTLIMEGYFKEEPVRLVTLRSHPNFSSDEKQLAELNKQMDAIAYLQNYFLGIDIRGNRAASAIEESEEILNTNEVI